MSTDDGAREEGGVTDATDGELLLPVGTRLLHIGPHKTGTTSLQGAFHLSREAIAAHHVHYAGKGRQPRAAAAAVVLDRVLDGFSADSAKEWPALVKEVRESHADRVVISSETFSNAGLPVASKVVDAFGPQTHVVITLRPLVRLLSSQWQQFVQAGSTIWYDDWLHAIFDADDSRRSRRFWRRHRHDQLADRWAEAAGTDNLTVVVLDESDRQMNLSVFERLVGLPAGTLTTDTQANRSLSLPEVELMREVNRQYEDKGWSPDLYATVFRYGVDHYLKQRPLPPDEPRVRTPAWAVARADEVAEQIVDGLTSSGIRIVGEVANLRVRVDDAPQTIAPLTTTTPQIAARAIIGVLERRPTWTDPTMSSAVSSSALVRTVAGRARARLGRS